MVVLRKGSIVNGDSFFVEFFSCWFDNNSIRLDFFGGEEWGKVIDSNIGFDNGGNDYG